MKIKKTMTFSEAWNTLQEDFNSDIIYNLDHDPDYNNTDPDLSFKDLLLKLRDEYLAAKTDEEQDAAIDTLQRKLTNLLKGMDWKIIIKMDRGGFLVMTGNSFVLDILFSVLEPNAKILFASILTSVGDDDI